MSPGRKVALLFVFLDAVLFGLTLNALAWLRGLLVFDGVIILPIVLPLALFGIALYLIDGYKAQTNMLSLDYTSQHVIALMSALVVSLLVTFVVIPSGYSLQQSRSVLALTFLVMIPVSITYRRWLYSLFTRARKHRSLIFIGDRASANEFRAQCVQAGMKQPIICAAARLENLPPESADEEKFVLFDDLLGKISSGELLVEAIVLRESNRDLTPESSQRLVDLYFGGVPTYTLELFHQVYWRKIPLYRLNQTWLFQEGFRAAREPAFERLKRMSDVLFALVGLTVFSPIFLVAAASIWMEDRGPIFFRQTRVGRFRVPFVVYKLRTMRSSRGGDPYAQPGDQRITRIGRFLRSSRLDEAPQLLNVFRGEMSLIGPRAEWDRLVAEYEQQIPSYHFRHLVRPGITGWAQVNYPYGANLDDTLRKLEYDLYYIRHYSFTLDASIVLKTVHVMLFGKGR